MKMMKVKSYLLGLMAVALMGSMTACHPNEVKKEIIVDPAETEVEYYISGKVADQDGAALANVEVKTNGASAKTDAEGKYKLTVKERGTYKLEFALEGYESKGNNEISMPMDFANRSTIVLNATLNKVGVKVNIAEKMKEAEEKNEVVVITEKGAETQKNEGAEEGEGTKEEVEATVAVTVAPGAIKAEDAGNVSVTPYVPENENKAQEDANSNTEKKVEASVVNVNIESEKDIILEAPVAIQVQAKVEKQEEAFETVKVYREVAARAIDWEYVCDAIYNAASNSYVMKLEKGDKLNGNYSFRVEPTLKSVKNNSSVVKSEQISNAGNVDAIDYKVSYETKMGWTAEFMKSVDASTQKQILKAIASKENGAEGVVTDTNEISGKISGDHILFYTVKANTTVKVYSMKLKGGEVDVKVTNFKGSVYEGKVKDAQTHSGGGLN